MRLMAMSSPFFELTLWPGVDDRVAVHGEVIRRPNGDLPLLCRVPQPARNHRVAGKRLVAVSKEARADLCIAHAEDAEVARLPVFVFLHVLPADDNALLFAEQRGAVGFHRRPFRRFRRLLEGPVVVEPELRPAVMRARRRCEAL